MGTTAYMYCAMMRKKDGNSNELCIRELDEYNEPTETIERLKARTSRIKGVWRIYRSVNSRNLEKGRAELIIWMIKNQNSCKAIDSRWRSILMQVDCKAERRFLIDIDSKDTTLLNSVVDILHKSKAVMDGYPMTN